MRDVGLKHPVSELAQPAIRTEEADCAETALCPAHGSQSLHLNVPGRVYLCPLGLCYWRASKPGQGMHSPLQWPKGM